LALETRRRSAPDGTGRNLLPRAVPAGTRRPGSGAHGERQAAAHATPEHAGEVPAAVTLGDADASVLNSDSDAGRRVGDRRPPAELVFSAVSFEFLRGEEVTMRHSQSRSSVLLLAAALTAAGGCTGTDVTINSTEDGTTAVVETAPVAPVEIDRDGIHDPPTPTPGPITPIYPIRTPPPTSTPRPR